MAKDRKQNTLHSGQTCAPVEVPSNAEATALHEMRRIKDRVRVLKRRISGLDNSGSGEDPEASIAPLEAELAILKNEWKDWEAKRKKAAHERMVLLGHEKE
jgi:hypothetical protein